MKKQIKTLLILIIVCLVSGSILKASDNNPKEVNGDCSECLNNSTYLNYYRQAEEGSMVATYQAAAALIQCYIQNGCYGKSSGYSYDDLMRMYNQNMETIRELGSEQPYIRLPDSPPENKNYDDNNYEEDSDGGTVRSAN